MASPTSVDIETLIRTCLSKLVHLVTEEAWSGLRERELVSVFCFGPLLRAVGSGSWFSDPRQIAVEVRVPIPTKFQSVETWTASSPRDIVIWPTPGATRLGRLDGLPSSPVAIIEWKHVGRSDQASKILRDWRLDFHKLAPCCASDPGPVGFAVLSERSEEAFRIRCARINRTGIDEDWLDIRDSVQGMPTLGISPPPPDSREVDEVIRTALLGFPAEVASMSPYLRSERNLVSLFAFGSLLAAVRRSGSRFMPGQIALEVPVPQVPEQTILSGRRSNPKKQVCKDLVLWSGVWSHCWVDGSPSRCPAAILEWKHGGRAASFDVSWLHAFARRDSSFVGFAVQTWDAPPGLGLSCARINHVGVDHSWLACGVR